MSTHHMVIYSSMRADGSRGESYWSVYPGQPTDQFDRWNQMEDDPMQWLLKSSGYFAMSVVPCDERGN